VAAKQNKKNDKDRTNIILIKQSSTHTFGPGASGLPHYRTPLVRVPDVIAGLAVWRHNNLLTSRVSVIQLVRARDCHD